MPILQWLNRDKSINQASQVPYRLLNAQDQYSYGDQDTENMVIQGDNLDTLKALLPYYAGKIKCIYIDPPYNTKSAFEHYDDNLEHTRWLEMMYPRLELLWDLLKEDGVILISINDDEGHYLKVMCDEIFGRKNFISTLVWHYEGNTDNQAKIINYHEYIYLYSKSGFIESINTIDPNTSEKSKLFKEEIRNTVIKNGPKNPQKQRILPAGFPANFLEGTIQSKDVAWPQYSDDLVIKNSKLSKSVTATSGWSSKNILEAFINSNFKNVIDSKSQSSRFEITNTGAIEVVKKRNQKKGHFISVLRGFGTTNKMRMFLSKLGLEFTYPKPVDLISYIIDSFTSENDIVLDSFSGSGTTAHAVLNLNKSEKKNLNFILVEMNNNSTKNVILPRLKKIIDGDEVTKIIPTGGGFRFYTLGGPIFDENGHIHSDISFDHLAAHIWFSETHRPYQQNTSNPLLGLYNGVAYYLLYNGILGDKRPHGGNVLTSKVFSSLPKHDGPKIVYGESSRLGPERLSKLNITFKQTPYDVKAR